MTILICGVGIAGPALAYWLLRRGHRPILVECMPELRVGGHAVDIRGTALEVVERMRLDTAVREARTQILTLSAVRPDGRRTYDVSLRPLHEARGDREVEIMRDDLVRICSARSAMTSKSSSGTRCVRCPHRTRRGWWSSSSTARPGRSTS
jgi:2-polyprenyl-6-methoxyphenol hydroxylase-like FAD-dependent oxidoreductase